MKRRTLLHLHGETFARRYQVASQAITAAAGGEEVYVVFWFDALRRLALGGFDDPEAGEDRKVHERHAALGLPPPSEMLAEARLLGARFVACETAVLLAGLTPADLGERVDEILGLQQIHVLAREAQVVLYV